MFVTTPVSVIGLLASYSAPNKWCAEGNAERSRIASSSPTVDLVLSMCSPLANHLFRDGLQLQVRCALVNLANLRVAEQLFDGVVLDESVAAVQVHGQ